MGMAATATRSLRARAEITRPRSAPALAVRMRTARSTKRRATAAASRPLPRVAAAMRGSAPRSSQSPPCRPLPG